MYDTDIDDEYFDDDKHWVTQEGEIMLISEMSTSHMKNCIRFSKRLFMEKGIDWRPHKIAEILRQLELRNKTYSFEF